MKNSPFIAPIWSFLKENPRLGLFTGVEGYRFYNEQNKTAFSRKTDIPNYYEDDYNSGILMDSSSFSAYHKSKLVPGVETIPSYFRFPNPCLRNSEALLAAMPPRMTELF